MAPVRELIDRIRDDRRVRRDFERIVQGSGLVVPDVRPERRFRRRNWRWWSPRGILLFLSTFILLSSLVLLGPFPYGPPTPLQTSFLYDRGGRLIAPIRPPEDRVVVPLRRIPGFVRQAFVAAEDERFWRHSGVDLVAIARAAWEDITPGGRFQGGSTITQQYVRNAFPEVGNERTLWRKIREAVMAVRMERRYSKPEILGMYLNLIYLGSGAYGVEAASRTYFGRHVWQLTLPEAALLAGLAAAPGTHDPRTDPDGAVARRNWVLGRMAALGMIARNRADRAIGEPLRLAPREPQVSRAAYFVDYITRYVKRRYGDDQLYRTGLQITSTLDLEVQRAAEKAIASVLDERGDPEAALVAIDVDTGGILAMVGGRDFNESEVNIATGQGGGGRQAGSAFKPFVLAQALREGIPETEVYDAPGSITLGGWPVSNYDGSSYGALSLRSATVSSVNTVYAQLIMDVGPEDVAEVARDMGITSELRPEGSLALGTSEVTPLEMASAYATLAAEGVYREPTGIRRMVEGDGDVVHRLDPDGERVLPADVAARVTDILQDAVASGTGSAASVPGVAVAGKTGTTEDHADAWFCGYTSEVAACVWMGDRDARVPMENVHGISVTGGTFPAQIWRAFMSGIARPGDDPGRGSAGRDVTIEPVTGSGGRTTAGGAPDAGPADDSGGVEAQETPMEQPEEPPPEAPPAEEPSPPEEDDGGGIIPDVIPSP